ncbi:hypothetical protein GOODEAATRI_009061 [Goodea atripinnis]|uniref:Secreted protein n=1 Tax=Goodea atripinnis TaxID=208336 RepID=A0ABV0PWI0_9TELE
MTGTSWFSISVSKTMSTLLVMPCANPSTVFSVCCPLSLLCLATLASGNCRVDENVTNRNNRIKALYCNLLCLPETFSVLLGRTCYVLFPFLQCFVKLYLCIINICSVTADIFSVLCKAKVRTYWDRLSP